MSYQYRHVKIERVVDGDTIDLSVDLGNKITWRENFRLNGIDTPERGTIGCAPATQHLIDLTSGGLSRIETFKPDKFGRWLADLYINTSGGELLVNKLMVIDGHAKEYFGGKK